MLQFRPPPAEAATTTRARHGAARRQRWRLWMLLISLGLVIATMRQLNKPATVQRLGQIFGVPQAVEQEQPKHQIVLGLRGELDLSDLASEVAEPAEPIAPMPTDEGASDALAQVQDNTYFRPAETEAWFGLFQRLQQLDAQQLSEDTLGELTYAQLLKQPDVYRGQVVTIRGTLRREEVEHPSKNSLGIAAYHRLVIQPRGGGHWPFIVYCLQLPDDLPRGKDLQASVSITGFFFKNWSYAWQDGLGIAPVVLARTVDWHPAVAPPTRRKITGQNFTTALAAACCLSALVVYLVLRNTRRPPRSLPATPTVTFPAESTIETVHEQLQRLTDTESSE